MLHFSATQQAFAACEHTLIAGKLGFGPILHARSSSHRKTALNLAGLMSDLAKKEAKKERADRAKGAGRECSCGILLTVQVCLYVVSGRITLENVL